MRFEKAHEEWIAGHLKRRKGERRGRLERGHGHGDQLFAKNVWWRIKGNFEHLHPEYEVLDWRGRSYFTDFCYIPGIHLRLLIEIKDYGTHVREKDRQGHCNECNRETFLSGMGYTVISFAYDDVKERPDICIALLRLVLSQFEPEPGPVKRALFEEKEVIRLTYILARPVRPVDVEKHFKINHRTAVAILRSLCEKGRFRPSKRGKGGRILSYEPTDKGIDTFNRQ